jgi:hypothetical protein
MTISTVRLALVVALCLALSWVSGALSVDALHVIAGRELRQCLGTLVAAGDSQQDAVDALLLAADDLHRAESVCSIWRETASWYQRSYLCATYRISCPTPNPPNKPSARAAVTTPTTVHIGTPWSASAK